MDRTYIVLKELAGNQPPTLNPIQQFMEPHLHALIVFWTTVWVITCVAVLYKGYKEYRRAKNEKSVS